MGMESFVMLHPEPLTHRLLLTAAHGLAENPLTSYPATEDRPAALVVKCKRVEATDFGLIRLVLVEDGQRPAVAVRPELVAGILDTKERLPAGFLSD